MHGKNKTICIAGKNQCAIDVLNYVCKNYSNYNIVSLPNFSDNGKDGWQNSFRKFSRSKNIEITNLKKLYKIKNLYLFSLEYENIIKINKFNSKNLFNLHFSLLPKYRGCHTNFYQIYYGEKESGVTMHKIDSGIDTGPIIDKIIFKIKDNHTAYDNYKNLLINSVKLFKKNIKKILRDNYSEKKQKLKYGSYFNRKSVDYTKIVNIKELNHNLKTHNLIRSLIFPPFQLPIYNGNKIIKSIYKKKKIKLTFQYDL
jgi:methionyl-tRNA formyltransferase